MSNIEIIGKYGLTANKWILNDSEYRKTSLSIANYDEIKNNDSDNYECIIYCYGTRLENHSKDGYNINNSQTHVDKILDYFKGKKYNVIVRFVMLDKDAPLMEDGILLANYISFLCKDEKCKSINIIAHSKSGVMFFDMIKHLNKEIYKKVNLYNIATPYIGTKMASPNFIYKDIKLLVTSHISNEFLASKVYNALVNFYEGISSNSHMDYDISQPNGIPNDKLDRYDEKLIKNLLLEDNLNAVRSINRFINYTTGIDETTLRRALLTLNFNGIGMCLINDLLMGKNSDGFVHTISEQEITKYMDIKSKHIMGSHHDLMSDSFYYSQILHDIDENIMEDDEKNFSKTLTKHII